MADARVDSFSRTAAVLFVATAALSCRPRDTPPPPPPEEASVSVPTVSVPGFAPTHGCSTACATVLMEDGGCLGAAAYLAPDVEQVLGHRPCVVGRVEVNRLPNQVLVSVFAKGSSTVNGVSPGWARVDEREVDGGGRR